MQKVTNTRQSMFLQHYLLSRSQSESTQAEWTTRKNAVRAREPSRSYPLKLHILVRFHTERVERLWHQFSIATLEHVADNCNLQLLFRDGVVRHTAPSLEHLHVWRQGHWNMPFVRRNLVSFAYSLNYEPSTQATVHSKHDYIISNRQRTPYQTFELSSFLQMVGSAIGMATLPFQRALPADKPNHDKRETVSGRCRELWKKIALSMFHSRSLPSYDSRIQAYRGGIGWQTCVRIWTGNMRRPRLSRRVAGTIYLYLNTER